MKFLEIFNVFPQMLMLRYSTENVLGDSNFEKPILTSEGEKYLIRTNFRSAKENFFRVY